MFNDSVLHFRMASGSQKPSINVKVAVNVPPRIKARRYAAHASLMNMYEITLCPRFVFIILNATFLSSFALNLGPPAAGGTARLEQQVAATNSEYIGLHDGEANFEFGTGAGEDDADPEAHRVASEALQPMADARLQAWDAFQDRLRTVIANGPEMLNLPLDLSHFTHAFVTYAGRDKQSYVNGAIMLGISLQRHIPEFPRVCVVVETMPPAYQAKLASAGWTLVLVPDFVPDSNAQFHGEMGEYWRGSYAKINIFRLPLPRALYLDADTYVLDDTVRDLFANVSFDEVPGTRGAIGMVHDASTKNFNSGVILFEPSLKTFVNALEEMTEKCDGASCHLDQEVINRVFRNRIFELDFRFNVHSYGKSRKYCNRTAIIHFTGYPKPAIAHPPFLEMVRTGSIATLKGPTIKCYKLYQSFFCDLVDSTEFLTQALQDALTSMKGRCNRTAIGQPPLPLPSRTPPKLVPD